MIDFLWNQYIGKVRIDFFQSGILIIGLIIFQFPYLSLGHYWDEAWVYAPALRAMAEGIPSIWPDAISLDLSRGHPLLFQFLGGVWCKVFGTSNASLHCFALSISATLLIMIQFGLKKIIGLWPAFLASIAVATSPMFLAQSAMVYPEMMMTLGLVTAMVNYVAGNKLFFSLGLALALFSKESALVFLIGFLLLDLGRLIFDERDKGWFAVYSIPILVIIFHLGSLYVTYGWILYPNHTDYIRFDLRDVMYHIRSVFRFNFEDQGRGWIIYPILILATLSIRLKHIGFNLLIIAIGFSAYKILIWKWVVPTYLYPPIMIVGVLAPIIIWWFTRKERVEMRPTSLYLVLTYLISVGFVVFSAMNFFTNRYMLSIVVLLITASVIIVFVTLRFNRVIKYALGIGIVGTNLFLGIDPSKRGENNIGLFNDLQVNEGLTNWMLQNVSSDELICTDFVIDNYLTNPSSGYVTKENEYVRWFEKICRGCDSSEVIIVSPTNGCMDRIKQEINAGNQLVYTDSLGNSWVSVYRRTN